jgi:crotonobetainyl-CoA:carnitine CoA-transferase CaiB-like acyl-CoA transferase
LGELLANPQLAARGYWDHTVVDGRSVAMPGNPLRATPLPDAAVAPHGGGGRALTMRSPPPSRPSGVEGALVLDFSAFWAGPSATRTLADLGAHVIRIERPGSRIDVDGLDADPVRVVQHVLFNWKMNRGKRSIVVDLKSAAGREVVHRLAERADVIIENFRPGVMASFGLDAGAIAPVNPGIVFVSLSGMGATGPRAWWGSYGPTIEAASGIEHRTGYAGGPPLRLGHTLPDGVGGLGGALAVLAGLRRRAETGRGSRYDVSQLETYAAMSGEDVLAVSATGVEPGRPGNSSPDRRVQGVYRCLGDDEWVAVAVDHGSDADVLARLLGSPADLAAALACFTASRTKEEATGALQGAGIAAFSVLMPRDLVDDPHLAARGYLKRPSFDGVAVPLPGSAIVSNPSLVRLGDRPRASVSTRATWSGLLATTTMPSSG